MKPKANAKPVHISKMDLGGGGVKMKHIYAYRSDKFPLSVEAQVHS